MGWHVDVHFKFDLTAVPISNWSLLRTHSSVKAQDDVRNKRLRKQKRDIASWETWRCRNRIETVHGSSEKQNICSSKHPHYQMMPFNQWSKNAVRQQPANRSANPETCGLIVEPPKNLWNDSQIHIWKHTHKILKRQGCFGNAEGQINMANKISMFTLFHQEQRIGITLLPLQNGTTSAQAGWSTTPKATRSRLPGRQQAHCHFRFRFYCIDWNSLELRTRWCNEFSSTFWLAPKGSLVTSTEHLAARGSWELSPLGDPAQTFLCFSRASVSDILYLQNQK